METKPIRSAKACVQCGKMFKAHYSNKIFCSTICKNKATNPISNERKKQERKKLSIQRKRKNSLEYFYKKVTRLFKFLDKDVYLEDCPWNSGRLPDSVTRNAMWF